MTTGLYIGIKRYSQNGTAKLRNMLTTNNRQVQMSDVSAYFTDVEPTSFDGEFHLKYALHLIHRKVEGAYWG
jgi:hypothetical protein